jgi:oligopeptidase B
MGRLWYEDGKYLHKKNTFEDFVASAQYLVDVSRDLVHYY